MSFTVGNLTSINQFFLAKIDVNFKEGSALSTANVNLEYNVAKQDHKLLYTNILEYRVAEKKDELIKSRPSRIYLPYVYNPKENMLIFNIKVINVQDLKDRIKSFTIQLETNNEDFFYFFWYLKWFMFGISIYTAYRFNKSYFDQLRQTRSPEQSHIIILGILLIVYNFPLSFYINETHPTIYFMLVTSFINILFYSYIIYLWLTTFEVT